MKKNVSFSHLFCPVGETPTSVNSPRAANLKIRKIEYLGRLFIAHKACCYYVSNFSRIHSYRLHVNERPDTGLVWRGAEY